MDTVFAMISPWNRLPVALIINLDVDVNIGYFDTAF